MLAQIGSVISKGASALSSMNPTMATLASTAMEGMFNQRAASRSRDFTKEMMQNRHQWQVADLEAAGLNRILSANMNPSIGSSAQSSISRPQLAEAKLLNEQIRLAKANTAQAAQTTKWESELRDRIRDKKDLFDAAARSHAGISPTVKTVEDLSDLVTENDHYQKLLKTGVITAAGVAALMKLVPANRGPQFLNTLMKLARKNPLSLSIIKQYKRNKANLHNSKYLRNKARKQNR